MNNSILTGSLFGIVFTITGFLIGQYYSFQTVSDEKCDSIASQMPDESTKISLPSTESHSPDISQSTSNKDVSDSNINERLTDNDADIRIHALFYAWHHQLVEEHSEDISMLANGDPDQQVSSFAQWIIKDDTVEENINPVEIDPLQPAPILSDYEDPDKQITQSLTENPYMYQQNNELLEEEQNLLDPMDELTEEEQVEYIKELVDLHEDQSIVALTELITHYNPDLKNTAIDGLISLLEMKTGHFDMIAQHLENNSVYLTEEQLDKFKTLTHPKDEE